MAAAAVVRMMLISALLIFHGLQSSGFRIPRHSAHFGPGAPHDVSPTDHSLRPLILNAASAFNNQSNDAFLFRVSSVHRAQRQIVKGVRYIVDLDISRTICPKRDTPTDLSQCVFQPEGHLHQTFPCQFNIWIIPWLKEKPTRKQRLTCHLVT